VGRLFWKFFFFFWLAQVVTSLGVGSAIWILRPQHDHPPPPPPREFRPPPGAEGPPRPPPPPLMRGPAVPILAGSVVSLGFAALLAWYFAQPIRTLRRAFEATAGGRLETRIGTGMGTRRDELADLGSDFDRMAERLQQLIDGQRRLLHDVSHELRSPLARLQAAADLMRQQPERAPEFAGRIEHDVARMDRLVGELLALARLDAGINDAAREAVDLGELVERIAEDARLEAEFLGCRLDVHRDGAVTVDGDPELLHRAIENVLRNALRHSPRGGTVSLAVRRQGGQARVVVADEGSGVPADELDAIFAPFFRAANAEPFAGHGLGLAITRSVAELHGGTAAARNLPGGGFVVTLSLPAAD